MNEWCRGVINKPHIIAHDHSLNRCYNCNEKLPHFTVLHTLKVKRNEVEKPEPSQR